MILYFVPIVEHDLVGHTRQVTRLRHSDRDVGVLLEDIARLSANGAETVAAMPFGGPDNRPILNWVNEEGLPRLLDIYFIDNNDYQDIIEIGGGAHERPLTGS